MRDKRRLIFSIDDDIVLRKYIDRENGMEKVTLSPKFQIVIPKKVRRSLGLRPGQKIQVFLLGRRIELIPERKMNEMRGFLRGISTEPDREEERL